MKPAVLLALMSVLLGVAGTGRGLPAQDVGNEVVPRQPTPLKVKSIVVHTVGAEDVLVVEQRQGAWLWVRTASGVNGWIKTDAVSVRYETAHQSPEQDANSPAAASPADSALANGPDGDRLYLIGAMGGSHVYTTYAYIGVLADSLSRDLYTAEQVQDLLKETISMSQSVVKQMQKVRSGELSDLDRDTIDKMIRIHELLQQQAEAASRFAATRSAPDAEEFDRMRTKVWPRIAELLGIEESPIESPAP
jgi:hypothetical protein